MHFLTTAKPFAHSSNDEPSTDVEYNLERLADDTLITTDISLKHRKIHNEESGDTITDHAKLTDAGKNPKKLPSSFSISSEKEKATSSAGHNSGFRTHRYRHRDNWKSKSKKNFNNPKKVVDRESREDKNSYDVDNEDRIESKEEHDDDEDVQLIIIPRKPQKHLPAKVQDDGEDREKGVELSDKETEEATGNSETSQNSDDSENFRYDSGSSNRPSGDDKTSREDDISFQERFNAHDDDHGGRATEKDQDYDLHLKVNDKSGTKVKLTGDLPGNIGNLVAEGQGGARVQVKNSRKKANQNLNSEEFKDGADGSEVTTDDVTQALIKLKSGKLKHAAFPSTVLLKPPETKFSDQNTPTNDNNGGTIPRAESNDVNQEISLLKSKGRDQFSTEEISKTVLAPPSQDSGREENENHTNNNVFSPMEFENGDDELLATSRLLDIARQADDESSLKELNESSVTKPSSLNGKCVFRV